MIQISTMSLSISLSTTQSFSPQKDPTKKRLKKKLFVTKIKIRIHSRLADLPLATLSSYSISNFFSVCGLGEEKVDGKTRGRITIDSKGTSTWCMMQEIMESKKLVPFYFPSLLTPFCSQQLAIRIQSSICLSRDRIWSNSQSMIPFFLFPKPQLIDAHVKRRDAVPTFLNLTSRYTLDASWFSHSSIVKNLNKHIFMVRPRHNTPTNYFVW